MELPDKMCSACPVSPVKLPLIRLTLTITLQAIGMSYITHSLAGFANAATFYRSPFSPK